MATQEATNVVAPPRENLVRALTQQILLRQSDGTAMPTMAGHFAVFNRWTEIDSFFEGHFIERIAPGAFKKTFRENRAGMKVTFNHGFDPSMGDKVLGPIEELAEDDFGAAYEVPLLDTSYNRDLIPGLEAGLYGSSFRFRVMREDFVKKPDPSDDNPTALPERTIKEAQVFEFGPVTYPAYQDATAGLRSLTDDWLLKRHGNDPDRLRAALNAPKGDFRPVAVHFDTEKMRDAEAIKDVADSGATPEEIVEYIEEQEQSEAEAPRDEDAAPQGTSESGAAEATPTPSKPATDKETHNMSIQEVITRQGEIEERQNEIYKEHGSGLLPQSVDAEWKQLSDEYDANVRLIEQDAAMRSRLERYSNKTENREEEPKHTVQFGNRSKLPHDIFNIRSYRANTDSPEEQRALMHDGARKILEQSVFPHEEAKRQEVQEHVEKILERDKGQGLLAEHMILTGSPIYQRAFGKLLAGATLTTQEREQVDLVHASQLQRALSLTGSAGGFAVPYTLDPTIMPTSNGVVNPLRQIARTITITGNEWRGVNSAGITASYSAEGSEAGDNAPVLAQPTANVEKAQAFIPFSIEIGEDWGSLQTEMARLLQDAKDALEADKFITGLGHSSNEPEGLLVGATAVVTSATAGGIGGGDLYSLTEALPPRFRPNSTYIGSLAYIDKIRQLDTAGGALYWANLREGFPGMLLGRPAYEMSTYSSSTATGSSVLTLGDFSRFLIVDRVGLNIEIIPHLFHTSNNRPSGQRGLYAHWRNTTDVNAWQAFRTLKMA